MRLIIDTELIKDLLEFEWGYEGIRDDLDRLFRENGTPIPDNATVCDIEQIRNEVQRMADSKILNMKIVLDLIDNYTKGDTDV